MTDAGDQIVLTRFDRIDSTSLHARRLVEAGLTPPRPQAFVASEQTGAIGRLGRRFISPRGGVWVTLLWPVATLGAPPAPESLGARLGWATLEAVRDALSTAGDQPGRAAWKWPNDVLVDGRKVLGVLTEIAGTGPHRAVLVGIGANLNVAPGDLPARETGNAASLLALLGHPLDAARFESRVLANAVCALRHDRLKDEAIGALRESMAGLGTEVAGRRADGTLVFGTVCGIDEDGHPLLRTAEGARVRAVNVDWPAGW